MSITIAPITTDEIVFVLAQIDNTRMSYHRRWSARAEFSMCLPVLLRPDTSAAIQPYRRATFFPQPVTRRESLGRTLIDLCLTTRPDLQRFWVDQVRQRKI